MAIPDPTYQIAVWRSAVTEGYSVRRLEELARKAATENAVTNGISMRKKSGRPMKRVETDEEYSPELRPMENSLKQKLGTQVHIRTKAGDHGEIAIEFYSGDDLERLSEILMNIKEN
jgi:ParB family chromosome partitioning protein